VHVGPIHEVTRPLTEGAPCPPPAQVRIIRDFGKEGTYIFKNTPSRTYTLENLAEPTLIKIATELGREPESDAARSKMQEVEDDQLRRSLGL
jgi:hypothetical protein